MDSCSFETVGFIALLYLSLKLAVKFYGAVSEYITSDFPDFSKYGKWSVVTGATDGIGKAAAICLAKRGQNLVIISRSEEKLKATKNEILNAAKVEVKYVVADFSNEEKDVYPQIEECVKDLDVGTLLNNVGVSYDYPEYFLSLPDLSNKIQNMFSINVVSVVRMTEIVLPKMVSAKRGLIMNVSSASALKPCPLLSLYGASKDFVDYLTQSLSYECMDKGVHLQTVMPFHVTSKLSKIRRPSFFVPTAEVYVESMLKTAGLTIFTYGYWTHALQGAFVSLLHDHVFAWALMKINGKTRKRALKKIAEKNAKKDN